MSNLLSSITTDREDILLQDYENPTGSVLQTKFQTLLENDIAINNYFKDIVDIWQCKWYIDDTKPGYNAGDYFWLNIYPMKNFIKAYHDRIKFYVDQVAAKPLPEYSEEHYDEYYSAITGYVDGQNQKPKPKLYDIGDSTKRIQLAVSLVDNNKEPIPEQDNAYWKKFFVNEDWMIEKIENYIDKIIDNKLSAHVNNYHLSGKISLNQLPYSNYMKIDFSNQDAGKMNTVTEYFRKPLYLSGDNTKNTAEYMAYRVWSNGQLEHFGTICTNDERFNKGNTIVIPLNWELADGTTILEKRLVGSKNDYLSVDEVNSKTSYDESANDKIDIIVENKKYINSFGSVIAPFFASSNYNIVITPVQGTVTNDLISNSNKTNENYNSLSSTNVNQNYFTNEINIDKTNRTEIVINNTGRAVPKYISYYAIGKMF